MKKIVAIILAIASMSFILLAFSSCKKGDDAKATTDMWQTTDAGEYISNVSAQRESTIDKEIGKCEKNKKIVTRRVLDSAEELRVIYEVIYLVDDTGKNNYKLAYNYYQKKEDYLSTVEYYKKHKKDNDEKLVESDEDQLLVVLRTDDYKVLTPEAYSKGTFEGTDMSAAALYKALVDAYRASDDADDQLIE